LRTSKAYSQPLTVVREGSAVFQLLSGEDQSLLVRRDTLLVLDLGLDIVDCVRRLDLEGDGFASEGLDKDLHTSSQSKNEVKSGLFLNVCK
jgi:hypothetical protein